MAGRRDPFLLDPEIVYLNHGAFGACPRPVFEVYQERQREFEREPVDLFERRLPAELAHVRAALGAYVGARAEDLALVQNATSALNAVVRSLPLGEGDEILTTRHEYGAIDLLLAFVCERTGARVVRADGVEAGEIWAGATERTRLLLLSHITSRTALLLPVEELCRRARDAGVLVAIDGAHAPGQVPLDLERLGADFYVGTCHKWLCAPKGVAFLHARPEHQELVDPLVVGWGWDEPGFPLGHDWTSTRDPAAYLAVPAAIDFVRAHGEQERCRRLLDEGSRRLTAAGFDAFVPRQSLQMACFRLPPCDAAAVERRLFDEFRIEVPIRDFDGEQLIRVSIAPYNGEADLDRLESALTAVLSSTSV